MNDRIHQILEVTGVPVNVAGVLALIFAGLVLGSAVRFLSLRYTKNRTEKLQKQLGSLLTWWVLFALMLLVVLLGKAAAVVFFTVVSLLGVREFRALCVLSRQPPSPMAAKSVWWPAYLAVPVQYLIIYFGWFGPFWTFIPVWVFCLVLIQLVIRGDATDFLETAGIMFLGLMLLVFLFSHAVLVLLLPAETSPTAGAIGLFVYLIVLTEVNDIAQALWGRRFGKRKITPALSPHKTWEGFVLGAATTTTLALLLAPLLTPFADRPFQLGFGELPANYIPALGAGFLISVAGFFGDVTMSGVKREVGVKDSGSLLPGQGGVLDRIDSLTFTAPVFFYYTYVLYH